jgi:CubicO group peptidase (beta-lactamase class C family)
MQALTLVTAWPVEHVAAAVVSGTGPNKPLAVDTIGDTERTYRLASLTKPIVAWAIMVAAEEGVVDLDAPLQHVSAPDGCTLRHLLSHAGGFGFDGPNPIAAVAKRRIYSNTGFERAVDELAAHAGMPFERYLHEAVFEPLGMRSAVLSGSPAYGIAANLGDVARFLGEMMRPTLLAGETVAAVATAQFPDLAGIVPDVGRFDPCPWGLGLEIRGAKSPHWMGRANSAATVGHFGGSGTMMWVDPSIDTGLVALTNRRFGEWRDEALALWPALSDAVVTERMGVG